MTNYHKLCKYCEEEFTSEILAKEHLFSCAYDEVMIPMLDHKDQSMDIGYGTETTHGTDPATRTDSDTHPIFQWMTGEITIEDLGGYTHEIVKPDAKWVITDEGARKVDFNREATFTWDMTEEDSRRWEEWIKDVENKVTVTWDGRKFLCTYEYDEVTGILHLEGEEIEDD